MKGSSTALAVFLTFSSVAMAGPRKPPASKPAVSSQPTSSPAPSQRKLFSKWHGGSCEINGERMTLVLGKKKKEIKLPDLRTEDEAKAPPIQLLCTKDGAKILYQRRIDMFDSYDELIKGASAAVTLPFKQKMIEGAFLKDGKEAIVAFENGQVQHLDLMDGDEFTRWTSKKPSDDGTVTRANIGESSGFVHVIFPETGKYVLIYTDCNGKEVAIEDLVKGGVMIRCFGALCVTKDKKNTTLERLRVPCPPKK